MLRSGPEFLLEDIRATPGRRFTNFSGDVSDRWIGALAVAAAVYGQRLPVLDEVVHRTIVLQQTVRRPPWASEARVARNGVDVSGLRVSGLRAGDVVRTHAVGDGVSREGRGAGEA